MTHSSISGAVLIGGHSRRMGSPKALMRLTDEGDTLIERAVATLRDVADDVLLVGAPTWSLPPAVVACRLMVDRGASAADGIVTALAASAHRFCVVVACDMPFLDASLLREMGELATRERRGVIAADTQGIHPLHAVWDREQLGAISAAVEGGERSLAALARLAGMHPVKLDIPGRSDPERWSVFNANTREDVEIARARAAGEG